MRTPKHDTVREWCEWLAGVSVQQHGRTASVVRTVVLRQRPRRLALATLDVLVCAMHQSHYVGARRQRVVGGLGGQKLRKVLTTHRARHVLREAIQ
jgi:hypothetical protein